MWVITESSGDTATLQKAVDQMNRPENLEAVYEEIREAERKLAEYKAADPALYAKFESWWEARNRRGSVPSIKQTRTDN